jgi:ATP adenylyltransferase
MDQLWTPWRMKYLENESNPEECPFCLALDQADQEEMLLVHRGKKAFVVLNRYPYTTGHLLVLPQEHQEKLSEIHPETRAELMEMINHAMEILGEIYQPDGFNIGLNMGSAAGAGIPKHLHWHVVPRWSGDTNFMAVAGEVRVLPELLIDTLHKVRSAW